MESEIREVVKKLMDGLSAQTGIVRIYAYGSRVRGDCDPASDLDLLVEVQSVTPEVRRQIFDRAWELSLEYGYVVSVAVVSQEAFASGPLSACLLARHIRQEGIEIAA